MGDVRGVSQHGNRQAERAVRLTGWIAHAFASGHVADLVLLVLAAEFVWLVCARRWPATDAAFRLAPGALMMVALRLALTGAAWPWIALALAASFPAHLADLNRRSARKA